MYTNKNIEKEGGREKERKGKTRGRERIGARER
jgi:hypothetical protein